MSQHLKVFITIAAVGIVGNAYGAPPGPGGPGGGGPMGAMGHSDMSMRQDMSMQGAQTGASHAHDLGSSPTQMLGQDTKLAANLEKLLPSGMTAQQACGGFRTLGSCVAAIHVASNLDIPFADLKAKVTGSGATSLGKAIHTLKPDADAKGETRKAEGQAREDLRTAQP